MPSKSLLSNAPCAAKAQANPGALADSSAALAKGEWPAYGGTYAAARYSPLAQIDLTNAKDLHVAWRWRSPDQTIHEANPAVGPSFVVQDIAAKGPPRDIISKSHENTASRASGPSKRYAFDFATIASSITLPSFGGVVQNAAHASMSLRRLSSASLRR
jgi:hypothetical protein